MRPLINPEELFNELRLRRFFSLHHANTIETSISFLYFGSIMSRGHCASQGYPQSPQHTDELDQTYGIWDDVFLNFSDFHKLFSTANIYGPVSFRLNPSRLLQYILKKDLRLSITQKQPHAWNPEDTDQEKWQVSINDLFPHPRASEQKKFINGWPDLVIAGTDDGLPLHLLDSIYVDLHPAQDEFYSRVENIFNQILDNHGLDIPVRPRRFCKRDCGCKSLERISEHGRYYKYETGAWLEEFGHTG